MSSGELTSSAAILGGRAPRTSLAWRNLTDAITRTTVSIGGIGFAIVLMFMQLGFLGSVGDTATGVLDKIDGNAIIRSPDYLHLYDTGLLSGMLPGQLESLPAVARAVPLDVSVTQWQNPQNGGFRSVAVMGIDLDRPAIKLPELTPRMLAQLRRRGTALIDDASAADMGPANGRKFSEADIGLTTDVVGHPVTLLGTFRLGTGLAANGALLVSRETFADFCPTYGGPMTSLVVVRWRGTVDSEAGLAAVRDRLASLSGGSKFAVAMSLDQAKSRERKRWVTETPIGMIFGIGVALAVVVGGVISYMVLASDVQSHLSEYATLKAIGYSNAYLVKTLLSQATMLALLAFPPSLLLAWVLYGLTSAASGLPIRMTWMWVGLVLLLTLAMCNAAGVFALRKLLRAEPANLF